MGKGKPETKLQISYMTVDDTVLLTLSNGRKHEYSRNGFRFPVWSNEERDLRKYLAENFSPVPPVEIQPRDRWVSGRDRMYELDGLRTIKDQVFFYRASSDKLGGLLEYARERKVEPVSQMNPSVQAMFPV